MLELEARGSGKVLVIGIEAARARAGEHHGGLRGLGLRAGADLIELDVHVTADGQVVVIHDGDVSRTTGGRGRIAEMTLAEIQGSPNAGSTFGTRFAGERIPTLAEVLDWARTRIPLVVEIKGDPLPAPGIEARVVELLRAHAMLADAEVISFHHSSSGASRSWRRARHGILYQAQLADTVGAARAWLADSVRPGWAYVTRALVEEIHAAGLVASTWNANDDTRAAYLVGLGVDSIGSDYPDRLRAYLDRTGRGWR